MWFSPANHQVDGRPPNNPSLVLNIKGEDQGGNSEKNDGQLGVREVIPWKRKTGSHLKNVQSSARQRVGGKRRTVSRRPTTE